MTDMTLNNLTTQPKPGGVFQIIGDGVGNSTRVLQPVEKKAQPAPEKSAKTFKTDVENNGSTQNTESKSKLTQQVQVLASDATPEGTSKKTGTCRNFEELVANLLIENSQVPSPNPETLEPVNSAESAKLEISAVNGKLEVIPGGVAPLIAPQKEVAAPSADPKLPPQVTANALAEPVDQNITATVPYPQPKVQEVPTDSAVKTVTPDATPTSSQISTEIKPDEKIVASAQIAQPVPQAPVADPKSAVLNGQPVAPAGLAETKVTETSAVPVSPESPSQPVEDLTGLEVTQKNQNPQFNQNPTSNIRNVQIASYREVQNSVASPAQSAEVSAQPVQPADTSSQPVSVESLAGETKTKLSPDLKTVESPAEGMTVVKAQTGQYEPTMNMNQAGEITQPVDSTMTVSSVSNIATASPARPVAMEMTEQITTHVQVNRDNLGEEMTVRLDPPELGQITIKFTNNGNEGLRGVIQVENPRTLTELNREAPVLMQKLNEAGIQVKDMEFRMNDQHDHRGDSTQDNHANMFNNFGANSQGRGGYSHNEGGAESFAGNREHYDDERYFNDFTETDDTSGMAGHYVSENSLNVMI